MKFRSLYTPNLSYDKIIAAVDGNLLVPTGSVFTHAPVDSSIPAFEPPTEEEFRQFLESNFGVSSIEEWMKSE